MENKLDQVNSVITGNYNETNHVKKISDLLELLGYEIENVRVQHRKNSEFSASKINLDIILKNN